MSLRYVLLAAASPLCLAVGVAHAETSISTTTTTPVATATAANGSRDSIKVTSAGAVNPTGGAAITMNSSDAVTLEGSIKITDANDATGILVLGGASADVKASGSITLDESTEIKDTDSDGDNDGPFATGARRYGIRVTGPAAFAGSIYMPSGSISIEGNDSAGVSAETAVGGSVTTAGITLVGDRSFGVHTASTVAGSVNVLGGVTVQGQGSVGVATDGDVAGRLLIGSTVTSTGFRYATRPSDAAIAKLDADDLLIGGSAVRVRSDVLGGILVDAPPPNLDANDADEDDDGIPDANETTGTITSFGSAPALAVGAADRAVRLGVGGTGVNAYGLNIKGSVAAAGIYDGISATAIQLGGFGGAVNVDGGVRLSGAVTSNSAKADSIGLRLGAGAAAPILNVADGSIKSTATATDAVNVRAVQVDAGASLASIYNSGTVSSALTSNKGSSTAILDASGTVREVVNARTIAATITKADSTAAQTGRAIALDLRTNTAGVTVRQVANASTDVTSAIVGDVLFGSGAARLDLLAGTLDGAVAFGSGADTLTIDGGAKLTGAITDAGGGLAMTVTKGRLTATNADVINLTSLNVGAAGELVFTADPANSKATQLNVSGAANLAAGAKIGLQFASKLTAPTTYTLVRAGSLTAGALDQGLLSSMPWLYKADIRTDTAQNSIVADVRRRTATEAGMTSAEAAAFDAVFQNFDRDTAVRDALLSKTDQTGFVNLYDQFLPDYQGGLFQVLAAANETAGRAIEEEQPLLSTEGVRVWTQEIAFKVKRDLDGPASYDADGFGLAAGMEAPDTSLGTLGVLTSFVNVNVDENGASAAESLTGSLFSAGLYWRESVGGLTANLGVTGGYAMMDNKRVVLNTDTALQRTAESDWNGYTAAIHGNASYTLKAGMFYAKPHVTADYFLFKEDGRTEKGGGEAIDLKIEDRSSSQLSAFAGVTLGARFGEESAWIWAPEITAGWRQVSGDGADVTTARFVAGGPSFSLSAPDLNGGGGVVRVALRGQGEYFDFAIEAGGEVRDDYEVYDGRLVARFLF